MGEVEAVVDQIPEDSVDCQRYWARRRRFLTPEAMDPSKLSREERDVLREGFLNWVRKKPIPVAYVDKILWNMFVDILFRPVNRGWALHPALHEFNRSLASIEGEPMVKELRAVLEVASKTNESIVNLLLKHDNGSGNLITVALQINVFFVIDNIGIDPETGFLSMLDFDHHQIGTRAAFELGSQEAQFAYAIHDKARLTHQQMQLVLYDAWKCGKRDVIFEAACTVPIKNIPALCADPEHAKWGLRCLARATVLGKCDAASLGKILYRKMCEAKIVTRDPAETDWWNIAIVKNNWRDLSPSRIERTGDAIRMLAYRVESYIYRDDSTLHLQTPAEQLRRDCQGCNVFRIGYEMARRWEDDDAHPVFVDGYDTLIGGDIYIGVLHGYVMRLARVYYRKCTEQARNAVVQWILIAKTHFSTWMPADVRKLLAYHIWRSRGRWLTPAQIRDEPEFSRQAWNRPVAAASAERVVLTKEERDEEDDILPESPVKKHRRTSSV